MPPIQMLSDQNLTAAKVIHSWLSQENLAETWVIGNPDLDGLLCLALLQHYVPTAHIAGFYSGEQIILTPEAHKFVEEHGLEAVRAIESDIYLMPSVGQHFTLASSPQPHLNPNTLRGFNNINQFYRKYPLNTLVFLWRWFGLHFPVGRERVQYLRAMFYPDGVLLKVLPYYQDNARDWLNWLQLGVEMHELLAVANTSESRQLARCIYKEFGNTQIGLTFKSSNGRIELANTASMLTWINWFADQLGLPQLILPEIYLPFAAFVQHRANNPQRQLQALDASGQFLQETRIVSDALVRSQEWSVTLVRDNQQVSGGRGLPSGLSSEPARWIRELDLNLSCHLHVGPCKRKNCG